MREITFREALREALHEEMQRDEKVYVMGEDAGHFGGLVGVTIGLIEKFGPDRVIETPISESGFVGAAVATATRGFRPVVEMGLGDVVLVAVDHILNTAAKSNYFYDGQTTTPIVFRVSSGFRPSGGPQQSQTPESVFANSPGMQIVMPSTPYDAKGLMKAAIRGNNPVMFFEPKQLYTLKGPVPEEDYVVPIGVADVKRTGSDATIIATGVMVKVALDVAKALEKDGISIEVVDPRSLRPLDETTLVNSVNKTGRVVIVHEANKFMGIGAEIAAMIAEASHKHLKAPIRRLGSKETPMPVSKFMGEFVIPQGHDIANAVRELVKYS
jgi:pyruvate/2-oxoglutarate/acetoin dehydrogenase E1 component